MRRARTVAATLTALAVLFSGGVQDVASSELTGLLDANWRGSYDLLVVDPASLDEVTSPGGAVAPSQLASVSNRLGLADVDAIRAVDGVEVAAPIGEVAINTPSPTSGAIFALPVDSSQRGLDPQAFRVTLTMTSNDGVSDRFLSQQNLDVVVNATDAPSTYTLDPELFPATERVSSAARANPSGQ